MTELEHGKREALYKYADQYATVPKIKTMVEHYEFILLAEAYLQARLEITELQRQLADEITKRVVAADKRDSDMEVK